MIFRIFLSWPMAFRDIYMGGPGKIVGENYVAVAKSARKGGPCFIGVLCLVNICAFIE